MSLRALVVLAAVVLFVAAQDCDMDACSTLDEIDNTSDRQEACDLTVEWSACLEDLTDSGCKGIYEPGELIYAEKLNCGDCDMDACSTLDEIDNTSDRQEACDLTVEWSACLENLTDSGCIGIYEPGELISAEKLNCDDECDLQAADCSTLEDINNTSDFEAACDLTVEWRSCLDDVIASGCDDIKYPADLTAQENVKCNSVIG